MTRLQIHILFLSTLLMISCKSSRNEIVVIFDRVDQLEIGSGVYKGDLEIGKVVKMDLFRNKVLVKIDLKKEIAIPVGSTFIIMPSLWSVAQIKVNYSDNTAVIGKNDTSYGLQSKKLFLDNLIPDSSRQEKLRKSIDKINEGVDELFEAVNDSGSHKTILTP